MKKIRTLAVIAAAAAASPLALGPGPARAATTYHIYGSGPGFGSGMAYGQFPVSCNDAWANSPTSGFGDAVAVNVSSRAGTQVPMNWDGVIDVAQVAGGGLSATYYNGNCVTNFATNQNFGLAKGATILKIPAGTKYVLFTANSLYNVTITF